MSSLVAWLALTHSRTNVPGAMNSSFGDEFEDLDADEDDAPGKQKMRVVFMPTYVPSLAAPPLVHLAT